MAERILTFEEARQEVLKHACSLPNPPQESLALAACAGRVLALDVLADRDYPPFDRATRDGYALRSTDISKVPAVVRSVGQVRAGEGLNHTLMTGQCVEIMTGAAVPAGADAVVMVEFTQATHDQVLVERGVVPEENIVRRGSECKAGERVLVRGRRLRSQEIAVAATVGCLRLDVFRKPTVAILPTGDEVVEPDAVPGEVQIRNSNAYSLAAQVNAAGGVAARLPIAKDERGRLRKLLEQGLEQDLLLLSGGVSTGKYDLVEAALTDLGAEFFFTGVKIQPGKPLVFGRAQNKYFFGLPGNPVSTMVTFQLFARALVDGLGGASPAALDFSLAELAADVKTKTGLTRFLPGKLAPNIRRPSVEPVPWKGSGDVFAQARANCLLVVPPDREKISQGEMVTILPID